MAPSAGQKMGTGAHGVHEKKHLSKSKSLLSLAGPGPGRGGSANVCPKSVLDLDLGVVVRPGLDSSGRLVGCLCRGNAVNNTHLDLRRGYVSPETSELLQ